MKTKPKAKRGPVVKTDWVVQDASNAAINHTFDIKQQATDAAKFWNRFSPVVYERKWRKIQ